MDNLGTPVSVSRIPTAVRSPAELERVRTNQRAWDMRTAVHVRSAFYDVEGFLNGRSSLYPPEIALAGDVAGRRLLLSLIHISEPTRPY